MVRNRGDDLVGLGVDPDQRVVNGIVHPDGAWADDDCDPIVLILCGQRDGGDDSVDLGSIRESVPAVALPTFTKLPADIEDRTISGGPTGEVSIRLIHDLFCAWPWQWPAGFRYRPMVDCGYSPGMTPFLLLT